MTKLNRHADTAAPDATAAALPVTALGLIGYFFIGTAAVLIPSVMPFITSEYMATGLTLAAIGLIFPARAVGGILGNLLAGVGSDRLGYSKLVWIAALALAVSMALVAAAHPWLLFLAGFALISIVQASLSTGINAMVADANRDSRARALNVLHGVYAVGATISPLVFGLILEQGVPWRYAMAATGLIWLVYSVGAFLLYRTVYPSPASAPGPRPQRTNEGRTLKKKRPRRAGSRHHFFLQVGTRCAPSSLQGRAARRPLCQLGHVAQRRLSVSVPDRLHLQRRRLQSAGLGCRLYAGVRRPLHLLLDLHDLRLLRRSDRRPFPLRRLCRALGLCRHPPDPGRRTRPHLPARRLQHNHCSARNRHLFHRPDSLRPFPTALAYGTRLYPQQSGAVTGLLNVAMIAGAMLPPLWTGIFSDIWSFQTALGINYSMAFLLLAVCLYLGRLELRARQPQE